MAKTNKRFFWITASILFALAIVATFMPVPAFAADIDLTAPLEILPTSITRVDSLPEASAALLAKYYDVGGNVYECVVGSAITTPISVGQSIDGGYFNIKPAYNINYSSILDSGDGCIEIVADFVGDPILILVRLSNGMCIYAKSDGLYVGTVSSDGTTTSYSSTGYPMGTVSYQLQAPSGTSISELPSASTLTQHISYTKDSYVWELIHTHKLVDCILEPPTCTTPGEGSVGCSYCEVLDIYNDPYEIAATGHDYISVHTPGTSTSVGYTTYTCSACSDTYTEYDEWNCDVQGHSWKEYSRTSKCTYVVVESHCSICEEVKTENVSGGLGHDLKETYSTGICTNRSVTYRCQRDGCEYFITQNEKRTHTYERTNKEGPCDNAVVTYTCSTCQASYTKTSTSAHSFAETSRTDPTCDAAGSVSYVCTACGATSTTAIAAKGHVWQLEQREEDGYRIKTYTCTVCNKVNEEKTALPQTPDVGLEDVENFVLTFFGSIASFFLYIAANVSFLGITGLDLLAILATVAFVVLLRKLLTGGE
ncbi:MAG: hypothetical protein J6D21_01580 [Clostridia bacterium]|nr:hypothetical protein [Clostridia bacterium]